MATKMTPLEREIVRLWKIRDDKGKRKYNKKRIAEKCVCSRYYVYLVLEKHNLWKPPIQQD